MTVFIIIGVIFALLGLFALSPAKISINYKGDRNGMLTIVAYIGVLRFRIYDTSKKQISKFIKKETKDAGNELAKKPKEFLNDIKKYSRETLDILSFLKSRIIIYNFKFYIRIGTGDAASTGILTGSLWAVLYNFISVCDNHIELQKHDIKVAPDFLNETFVVDFEAIIGLKVIHSLFILRKFLFPKGRKEKKHE